MKRKWSQSGQVVLITLLVLSVAITVALSLIGRTTTDLTISNQIEESSRAFSAAEAGIEESLKTGVSASGTFSGGVAFSSSVNALGGGTGVYRAPATTPEGNSETLWLANNTGGVLTRAYTANTIALCWGRPEGGAATNPAVVAAVYYVTSGGSYRVARVAFDPNAASNANNFSSSGAIGTNCGLSNAYRQTIDFTALGITPTAPNDMLLAVRIKPLYNDAQLAVDTGGVALPRQGNIVTSTGTVTGSTADIGRGVTRKVVVYQQNRTASGSIFDYVIYSGQGSFVHVP